MGRIVVHNEAGRGNLLQPPRYRGLTSQTRWRETILRRNITPWTLIIDPRDFTQFVNFQMHGETSRQFCQSIIKQSYEAVTLAPEVETSVMNRGVVQLLEA